MIGLLLEYNHCFEKRHRRNNIGWEGRWIHIKVEKEICENEVRAWKAGEERGKEGKQPIK